MKFSSEVLLSAVVALVIGAGAFFALQTSVEHGEDATRELAKRLDAIEDRERQDREFMVRLDARLEALDQKLDVALDMLRRNGKPRL